MKRVLLDTNMLMAVAQFRVDIFRQLQELCDFTYEVAVLDKTIAELEHIKATQRSAAHAAARVALQLVKLKKIHIIETPEGKGVDALLAELSHQGAIVATQDKELKQQLKRPYIILRQKRRLVLL